MFPATIKQLVITSCKKIKDLIIQIISSYFLVVSSWNEPRAYFHTFHILAHKIDSDFKVLYKAENGRVAHECIFDCRTLPVSAEDVAKRLMDYGFHAPTLSWPVLGTMMVEPTESESLDELKRFVDAMEKIKREIFTVPDIVKNSPHTEAEVCGQWTHPYTREEAVFPNKPKKKFWPAVGRIDNVHGDRNLVCSCSDYFSEVVGKK